MVEKKRLGILAQSMGGPSVTAALPLKISSLVFLSAVFSPEKSLLEVIRERNVVFNPKMVTRVPRSNGSLTELGSQIWVDFKRIDLKDKLAKHASFPILFLHGALDDKVSTEEVKRAYQWVKREKELVIYPRGDHGLQDVSLKLRQAVLAKIVSWSRKTLGPTTSLKKRGNQH